MGCLDRDEIIIVLAAAHLLIEQGDVIHAERIYKTVLNQAETVDREGPLTGLVLLDLHDLYYEQGREDEAAPVWERIRRILIRQFGYCKTQKFIDE